MLLINAVVRLCICGFGFHGLMQRCSSVWTYDSHNTPPPSLPPSRCRCRSSTFSPVSSFTISKKPFISRAHMCRHFFQEPRSVQLPGFWSHLTCLMAPSRETRGEGEKKKKTEKRQKKKRIEEMIYPPRSARACFSRPSDLASP